MVDSTVAGSIPRPAALASTGEPPRSQRAAESASKRRYGLVGPSSPLRVRHAGSIDRKSDRRVASSSRASIEVTVRRSNRSGPTSSLAIAAPQASNVARRRLAVVSMAADPRAASSASASCASPPRASPPRIAVWGVSAFGASAKIWPSSGSAQASRSGKQERRVSSAAASSAESVSQGSETSKDPRRDRASIRVDPRPASEAPPRPRWCPTIHPPQAWRYAP